jgi:hypothetical protein
MLSSHSAASFVLGTAWLATLSVGSSNKVFRILMNFMQIDNFSIPPQSPCWSREYRANGNAIDDRRHYNARRSEMQKETSRLLKRMSVLHALNGNLNAASAQIYVYISCNSIY